MQSASLTNEDSTTILLGLYDVVRDFHRALLRKVPPTLPNHKTSLECRATGGTRDHAAPLTTTLPKSGIVWVRFPGNG